MQNKPKSPDRYLARKRLLGLALGLLLAIIVLKADKKLWWPLELETINGRNNGSWFVQDKLSTEDIAIILFDDKTQFLLRENGLPIKDFGRRGRNLISRAVEKLEGSGVSAIGINLNLSSFSDPNSDEQLAKTISKYKNIVIANSIYLAPFPSNKILKSASSTGYGELYADYDKVVHRMKLVDENYENLQSFSYALYKTVTKADVDPNLKSENAFYLKYPNESVMRYSFIDLIQGKISPSKLKEKVVILGIGLNSKLIRDQLVNPFQRGVYVSGSEVQAVSLANLLNKSYLFKLSLYDYPIHFIILSMILGMIFSSIPIVRGLIIGTVLLITQISFAQISYVSNQLLVELIPLLFILLGNFVIGSLFFLQLNLQEQNIELAEALAMLSKRSKELENSQSQLQSKNIQLSGTLSELNKKVTELKEVRKQLSSRSEEERKRIARELHDDTLSRITDLKIYIESMINTSNLPISEKKRLGASIQTLDNVTYEIRRIINALRPSMLDNVLGLIPAIENLLDELSRRSHNKIQTKLSCALTKLKLPEVGEINLYRIIQEALNNIYKHSGATRVEVVIEEQPGQVLILVRDNGSGFKVNDNDKKGFGLVDMKERAELIEASLQYLHQPDGIGTTLEITIPTSQVVRSEKKEEVSLV